eukprot:TRINITY_DN243_c14_g1_i1.p1 TRINITY_DN243_c14_g1~~TRINITY_DN243_c14_g1_i1.p1  ORF type:complete len:402 (+),score=58.19 TRINITY_DN243_c14_g1_i1:69-1208(+)
MVFFAAKGKPELYWTTDDGSVSRIKRKGGSKPDWHKKAAKGPVPKCMPERKILKGKGLNRPEDHIEGPAARLMKQFQEPTTPRGSGRRSVCETPSRRVANWLGEDWLQSPPPTHRMGIRISSPRVDPSVTKEKRILAQKTKKQREYSLAAPYAKPGDDYRIPYRRHRKAISPPHSVASRSSSLVGDCSERRVRGKSRASKPVEVGIFEKEEISPRPSKAVDPRRHTNLRSSSLFSRPERQFLPTNFREKGLQSSREGAEGCTSKGSGRARPTPSLVTAWNVAEDAPTIRKTCTKQARVAHLQVPWGTQKKLSMSRYHRKKSIEASMKYLKKKATSSRKHGGGACAGSTFEIGSDAGPSESPRGKRMWAQPSNNVIPSWQ